MHTAPQPIGVTEAHRRAAFKAMAWAGWTYEQAMEDTVRSRIVHLRARQLCNAEAKVWRHPVAAVHLSTPCRADDASHQPLRHAWASHVNDLKRAAAGDRDDD